MAMFHSYVSLPEGTVFHHQIPVRLLLRGSKNGSCGSHRPPTSIPKRAEKRRLSGAEGSNETLSISIYKLSHYHMIISSYYHMLSMELYVWILYLCRHVCMHAASFVSVPIFVCTCVFTCVLPAYLPALPACLCVCLSVRIDGWPDGWMGECLFVCGLQFEICLHVCIFCTYVCTDVSSIKYGHFTMRSSPLFCSVVSTNSLSSLFMVDSYNISHWVSYEHIKVLSSSTILSNTRYKM